MVHQQSIEQSKTIAMTSILPPHEWLKQASTDAETAYEYNLRPKERTLRPSRIGLSLMQLLLEDFVFWRLAPEPQPNVTDADAELKKTMNFSIGYLAEQMTANYISQRYPTETIISQPKIEYAGIDGTCDLVAIDNESKLLTVWETKALNVESLKEAKETKLLVDDWGYYSQLAFYMTALANQYSDFGVQGRWFVWAKKANRSYVQNFPSLLDAFAQTKENVAKVDNYNRAKLAYETRDTATFVELVLADPVPAKDGYRATCAIYFNPLHKHLLDSRGYVKEDASETLAAMVDESYNEGEPSNV